jgi:hypothetical protein
VVVVVEPLKQEIQMDSELVETDQIIVPTLEHQKANQVGLLVVVVEVLTLEILLEDKEAEVKENLAELVQMQELQILVAAVVVLMQQKPMVQTVVLE